MPPPPTSTLGALRTRVVRAGGRWTGPWVARRTARWSAYRRQVVRVVTTAADLRAVLVTLPAGVDDESAGGASLLWVSDVHDNPLAADLVRSLVATQGVDAVLDTGDLTDHGLGVENRLASWVGDLEVPYVWVRGNHDGRTTQDHLAHLPGVTVLDEGAMTTVAGLRIAGTGDQQFTPWRSAGSGTAAERAALAAAFDAADAVLADAVHASIARGEPVHVVAVHRRPLARRLHGVVPLVLDGHTHRRRTAVHDGTLRLTQGSTGGAGVRCLETPDGQPPVPLCATVLRFDAAGALSEVEEITVGGLGHRWAHVERLSAEQVRARARTRART